MPTMVRAENDERDGLIAFLDEQRAALRRAVHGLTDAQAAVVPSASGMCLGGLVKHAARVERNWADVLAGRESPAWDREAEFRMEDESLAELLDAYEVEARLTDSTVADVVDLGAPVDVGAVNSLLPAGTRRSARWILLHLIEETARHAGHADVIRESLDGATAFELVDASGTPRLGS